MRGRHPKPAHMRQNRTKKAGASNISMISAPEGANVPPLPEICPWHDLTVAWWGNVWTSPMAGEYLPSDVDGLVRLAMLVNEFYLEPKPTLLAEVRLQEQRFGLSPLDRSRLQWEVAKVEEAERKQRQHVPRRKGTDPRAVLQMVK